MDIWKIVRSCLFFRVFISAAAAALVGEFVFIALLLLLRKTLHEVKAIFAGNFD
jgi:hypothetical protein